MTESQWAEFDRWPKFLTVDPADRKAWLMLWGAINPRDEYIFFEEWPQDHYWDFPFMDFGAEGYVELINRIEGGGNSWGRPMKNVVWRIMDPHFGLSAKADMGLNLRDMMAQVGMSFECKLREDIETGHAAVRQRLWDGTLMVTPNCNNLRYAFARYTYDEYIDNPMGLLHKPKPREEFKDPMDALRYGIRADLHYIDLEHDYLLPQRRVRNLGAS